MENARQCIIPRTLAKDGGIHEFTNDKWLWLAAVSEQNIKRLPK
jgi:hypothetical protein